MSVDRLYIAHTRRIITTAVIIRISFLKVNYTTTHNRQHQEREHMPIDLQHTLFRLESFVSKVHRESFQWIYSHLFNGYQLCQKTLIRKLE